LCALVFYRLRVNVLTLMSKDNIIAARVNDETQERFEERAWREKRPMADIQRELVDLFLNDEEVEQKVIKRLNGDQEDSDD